MDQDQGSHPAAGETAHTVSAELAAQVDSGLAAVKGALEKAAPGVEHSHIVAAFEAFYLHLAQKLGWTTPPSPAEPSTKPAA